MKTYLRLIALFKPYWGWMALGVLISTLTLFANIALMAVSGWFIAAMALAGIAGVSMNYFTPAAIIRGLAIIRTLGRYGERLVTHEATFRLLAELRHWFYLKLEPLVPNITENYRSGDLLARIRSDIDVLDSFYIRVFIPIIVAVLAFVVLVLVLSAYDASLAWIMAVMLLLAGIGLPLLMLKLGKQPGQQKIEQSAELSTAAIDGVQGMAELIVAGAATQQAQKLMQADQALRQSQVAMSRASGLGQSGMLLLTGLSVFLIILAAMPLLQSQVVAPAELAMLTLLSIAAFESVLPLPEGFRLLGEIKLAANRLFELADTQPDIIEPSLGLEEPASFDVQLNDIQFRYKHNQPWILNGFNIDIKAGEKVAILGPTGAGKSSLIQLILKQRLVQSGEVLIGGKNIEQYCNADLRQWISVVPQKNYLFNTSIKNNLILGKPQASEEDIQQVCDLVGLNELISTLPDGLESWVGETGIKLSGGEQKRVAIARALLRDFEVLVLDEPTEGLDEHSAHAMLENILQHYPSKTLLMITHRKHDLDSFDKVVQLG